MSKYIRKKEIFDATLYKSGSDIEDCFFVDGVFRDKSEVTVSELLDHHMPAIKTLGGYSLVCEGDWILETNYGYRIVLNNEEFNMLYEPYKQENKSLTVNISVDDINIENIEKVILDKIKNGDMDE